MGFCLNLKTINTVTLHLQYNLGNGKTENLVRYIYTHIYIQYDVELCWKSWEKLWCVDGEENE